MDEMLVKYILMVLWAAVESQSFRVNTDLSLPKNDTLDSLLDFKSNPAVKPKRQLDNFEIDLGSFEDSSFFKTDKTDDATALDILDSEDFSGLMPTSLKVTRSNIHELGTHGINLDSASLSSENYQSDAEATQKNPEIQGYHYSNEEQNPLSQSQLSTTINNLGTTPYYSNISNQPRFVSTKPSAISADQNNSPTLQYSKYPPMAEYPSNNPIYSSSSQLPIQAVGLNHQTHPITYSTPYKAQYSHPSKYAPLHTHNQQQQHYGAPYRNAYNNILLTTAPTVEINGKKLALPYLQLQTDIPNYVQTFANSPNIYGSESGLQYKAQPGISFDYAKPQQNNQRLGTNAPFLVTHNARTSQFLPLKTSASTAQFPQYKGASVSQSPSRGFSVIPNDYQEFKLQRQLHFNKHPNNKNNGYGGPKNYQKPMVYSNPSAQIKTDVEIIDKKKKKPKPTPPKSDGDDENDDDNSGEDNGGKDSYLPKDEDDDRPSRNHFKESELEGDFVPSKSFPFNEYDRTFNKPKKSSFNSDDDDEDDDDSDDDSHVNLAAKYRYSAESDDEGDENYSKDENESSEDEPKSKHKSYPVRDNYKNHYGSGSDEDGEATYIKEKKKHSERNNPDRKTRHSQKDRGRNNQEEYVQSHNKKYRKPTDYDAKYSKSRPNNRRPDHYVKNKHRVYRDESGEPSTKHLSTSFPQSDDKSKENIHNPGKITDGDDDKSSPTIWRNSYGRIVKDPDEDSSRSIYSQEEAAGVYKHPNTRGPRTTTQEYTTRPAHKTSTKGLFDSYPTTYTTLSPAGHHSTRKKEEKQKPYSNTHDRFLDSGVKSSTHPIQKFSNIFSKN